jgi:hypothetical protein
MNTLERKAASLRGSREAKARRYAERFVPRPLTVGDAVRTLPTVRPKGYANRRGFVASLNRRDGELGVTFAENYTPDCRAEAWFVPGELEKVPHTPQNRPGDAHVPSEPIGAP